MQSFKSLTFLFITIMVNALVACNSDNSTTSNSESASTQPSGGSTSADGSYVIYSDLAYASTSTKQKLDLYIPSSGTNSFPVIVYIHGGAFLMGDKASSTDVATIESLVKKGYAVASINYRLSSDAIYPAQIHDAKAAVRFIRAQANTYKLNSEKIASFGGSAGGNLAALLGTTGGVSELEDLTMGNNTYSSKVIATVDWFGPINFLTMDTEAQALGFTLSTDSSTSPESKLIGAAIQTVPEKVAKANPSNYISSDDAAFFIQHGSVDRNIPYSQGENFAKQLSSVLGSNKVNYELIEGAAHGGSQFNTTANIDKINTFLATYLK